MVQNRQLRREDEFVGPMAEIDYWRAQLARFNSIVEFMEMKECKMFIDFLDYVHSRDILKVLTYLYFFMILFHFYFIVLILFYM